MYRYVVLSSFIMDEASFSGFVCFYFVEFQGVKYSIIFSRSRHGSLDIYSANYIVGEVKSGTSIFHSVNTYKVYKVQY